MTTRTTRYLCWILLLAVVPLIGCSESERAWREAKSTNSVEAYEAFMAAHPESGRVEDGVDAIRALRWTAAQADGSLAALKGYLDEYPDASNIDEARAVYDAALADDEIASIRVHIKHFLNGNAAENVISELNGLDFVERDQNPAPSGIQFFGTSNMRVAGTITSNVTGLALSLTYEPTANRMIEKIDELTPDDGIEVEFVSGRRYEYRDGGWVRKESAG